MAYEWRKLATTKEVEEKLNQLEADIGEGNIVVAQATNAANATVAQYASADTSKGTIEERLTNLGFKTGSVVLADGITATRNELKRQGNYVLGRLVLNYGGMISNVSYTIGTIPEEFRPAAAEEGSAVGNFTLNTTNLTGSYTYSIKFDISTDGVLKLIAGVGGSGSGSVSVRFVSPLTLNFGYEAEPLS